MPYKLEKQNCLLYDYQEVKELEAIYIQRMGVSNGIFIDLLDKGNVFIENDLTPVYLEPCDDPSKIKATSLEAVMNKFH